MADHFVGVALDEESPAPAAASPSSPPQASRAHGGNAAGTSDGGSQTKTEVQVSI